MRDRPAQARPEDVVELLRARVTRGSQAPHDDGARIALVIEGGAMRGVVSAGMVWALEDLGYAHAFDAVYGSSAGAINAAYFLAGQAGLGTTIYFEDINTRAFIDLSRAWRGLPIVDLRFLLDDVARRRKPLDVGRVIESTTPLSVLATDVDSRASVAFRDFGTAEQLFAALRAGATMPVVAGGPFDYDGRRLLDASLSEPIPLPTAEAHGHTHIVILLTRSGAMNGRPSAFDRYFVGPRLRRISPELASRYLSRSGPYSTLIDAIDAGTGISGLASVLGIRVDGLDVSKLETRREVLAQAARRGYDTAMSTFSDARRVHP
jgi:predicted patatin/cPLA2 family phospholipase